jgi:hypothetical protein
MLGRCTAMQNLPASHIICSRMLVVSVVFRLNERPINAKPETAAQLARRERSQKQLRQKHLARKMWACVRIASRLLAWRRRISVIKLPDSSSSPSVTLGSGSPPPPPPALPAPPTPSVAAQRSRAASPNPGSAPAADLTATHGAGRRRQGDYRASLDASEL